MATNIFAKATAIDISASQVQQRGVSQAGFIRTHVASPVFYHATVTVRPFYEDEMALVESEIIDMGYGSESVTVSVPHNVVWAAGDATEVTAPVLSTNAAAGDINIRLSATGTNPYLGTSLSAGSYIQIAPGVGNTDVRNLKVYQVKSATVASGGAFLDVTLNTPLCAAYSTNDVIRFGSACQFKFMLVKKPNITTVPGQGGRPLFEYDSPFEFREVFA